MVLAQPLSCCIEIDKKANAELLNVVTMSYFILEYIIYVFLKKNLKNIR